MGFFDEAQDVLDRGVSVARGAVSGMAVESRGFVREFVRLCTDGAARGWHEGNGGNLSYRLTLEDVSSSRSYFYETPEDWQFMDSAFPAVGGSFFLITASGSHLRRVGDATLESVGIIEVTQAGDAWRTVWGFANGSRPTSELIPHLAVHAARAEKRSGMRVIYHAHPLNVVAITKVLAPSTRDLTRTLWKTHSEAMVMLPRGIAYVPWMRPAGTESAQATACALSVHDACVWEHHGVMVVGEDFDGVYGKMEALEKASGVYLEARAACGGDESLLSQITDEGLHQIAEAYRIDADIDFLN